MLALPERVMLVASLEEEIQALLAEYPYLDASVIVETQLLHQRVINVNPGSSYETASTAKIPIALVTLDLLDLGELKLNELLSVQKHRKRKGTGILRYFGRGFTLELVDVLQLMLMESDNTATNILLEKIGGQARVNALLNADFKETGLTEREDTFFESDIASAETMLRLFKTFIEELEETSLYPGRQACLTALRNNHFLYNLRHGKISTPLKTRVFANTVRLVGLSRWQAGQLWLLRKFQERASRSRATKDNCSILGKEGVLPVYEGNGYLHLLAFFSEVDFLPQVAIYTRSDLEEGYSTSRVGWLLEQIVATICQYDYSET